jgi:hypothetical protein
MGNVQQSSDESDKEEQVLVSVAAPAATNITSMTLGQL